MIRLIPDSERAVIRSRGRAIAIRGPGLVTWLPLLESFERIKLAEVLGDQELSSASEADLRVLLDEQLNLGLGERLSGGHTSNGQFKLAGVVLILWGILGLSTGMFGAQTYGELSYSTGLEAKFFSIAAILLGLVLLRK